LSSPVYPGLPFTSRALLAPMEGVTDPVFRSLVLARQSPEVLGGTFTEFLRILDRPRQPIEIERMLGERTPGAPVGIQLMGADLEALGGSARNAVELGVPLIDLNFGCPAKGALRGCAGAAQLKDPAGLERVVASVVSAVDGAVPVTAKIRAGYDHAKDVEDLARAAEAGGAAMLTVHARTRAEGYSPGVDWSRIARAVNAIDIPVCGNGDVDTHTKLQTIQNETGCAFAMVGRGALGNPWIFSGETVSAAEQARFLSDYADAMRREGAAVQGAAARVKQLVKHWTLGALIPDEATRVELMREKDGAALLARIAALGEAVRG
jgi:tRNA-dihydrouridine synthase C